MSLLLLASAAPAMAQTQHRITLDDLLHLNIPDNPQCSPDGQSVAYSASQPDGKEHVWMIHYDGSDNHSLTSGDQGEYRPRFSPDGKYVSYLSSSQLWLQPLSGGGRARAIARALSYEWSPDASTLALVVGEPGRPGATHIQLYSLATHTSQPLARLQSADQSQPSWSPDGKSIAFIANQQVWVGAATPGASYKSISESNATPGAHIDWSHDGKTLAFLVGEQRRLAIAPVDGSTQPRLLKSSVELDRGGWSPSWGDSGKAVYMTVADDMSINGFRIPINDAEQAGALFARPVVLGARHHAAGCAAVISSADTKPQEIMALDNGALRQVTHLNDPLVAAIDWPRTDEVKFVSKNGTEIHGLLTYPTGYRTGARIALVLRIHGGPLLQDDHSFSPEVQYFAANGYAVLRINYRGSDGRGATFFSQDAAIDDLEAGLAYTIHAGIADPERLGVEGWDYGAALAQSLIASGHTRFKAAVIGFSSPADARSAHALDSRVTPTLLFVDKSTRGSGGARGVSWDGTVRVRYERSLGWFDQHLMH